MRDLVLVIAVVLAFAFLVTAHVAIAIGLLGKPPRWRALIALVFVPVAPYWAWRERMRVRSAMWIAGIVVYVLARVAAAF